MEYINFQFLRNIVEGQNFFLLVRESKRYLQNKKFQSKIKKSKTHKNTKIEHKRCLLQGMILQTSFALGRKNYYSNLYKL